MLLPNEWIENSIETYIYQHTTKSQVIYWVVLLAVTVTLVALPFIYVDISVQGSGVVRPVAEKAEITSSITEIVDSVFVKEGDQVNKGDVILRFRTNNSDYKINYQTGLQDQLPDQPVERLQRTTCRPCLFSEGRTSGTVQFSGKAAGIRLFHPEETGTGNSTGTGGKGIHPEQDAF